MRVEHSSTVKMTHAAHITSSSSKRASVDSEDASQSPLARRSRESHRRRHEDDVEAQKHTSEPSHPHITIQDNPDHHQHEADEDGHSPRPFDRTDTVMSKGSIKSMRRRGRADTTHVVYGAAEMGRTTGWSPGQEPGIDTSDPAPPYSEGHAIGGDASHLDKLNQRCEITVVDFSSEAVATTDLDNDNIEDFLQQGPPDWSDVRWINVNGLSWDVIRVLGNHKRLHRLAIEDLIHTKNRTKADWYSDHTYIVLPLQKLINIDEHDSECDSEDDDDDDDAKSDAPGSGVQGENPFRAPKKESGKVSEGRAPFGHSSMTCGSP